MHAHCGQIRTEKRGYGSDHVLQAGSDGFLCNLQIVRPVFWMGLALIFAISVSGLILRNRLHKLIRSTDSEKERINNMKKTVLHINGMMCGMCESHINDVIRREFKIKKVTSSHSKGITEILSEEPLNEEQLRNAIKQTGYTLTEIEIADAPEKKGFFAAMKSGKKDK